jgi:hypothetical protein
MNQPNKPNKPDKPEILNYLCLTPKHFPNVGYNYRAKKGIALAGLSPA